MMDGCTLKKGIFVLVHKVMGLVKKLKAHVLQLHLATFKKKSVLKSEFI